MVSADRRLLRHLSRFLGAFGYEVRQAAESSLARAALRSEPPDFLIVDSQPDHRSVLELCRSISSGKGPVVTYVLLLVSQPTARALTEALEAGVDDFLAQPIVYGELLVRLRLGARVLEFERRLRQQATTDPLTGLASFAALCDGWPRRRAAGESAGPSTCVLIDLDLLSAVNHDHGHAAGDSIIQAAAEKLKDLCGEKELLGSLGGGRFCVLLTGVAEVQAAAWAESARGLLAETEVVLGGQKARFTASLGIAAFLQGPRAPEEAVARASQAVQAAKHSGRNCVVRFDQLDADARDWADFAAPGRLLERTTARDVMTPCTLFLMPEDTVGRAAAMLEQSRLRAVPVVHHNGALAGLVLDETVLSGRSGSQKNPRRVRDVMTADVPAYEEETPLAALRDFFTHDSRSAIVIVHQKRPTGLVTPDNLAALSTPLTSESFAPRESPANSTAYLRVPDLCPLEAAEMGSERT